MHPTGQAWGGVGGGLHQLLGVFPGADSIIWPWGFHHSDFCSPPGTWANMSGTRMLGCCRGHQGLSLPSAPSREDSLPSPLAEGRPLGTRELQQPGAPVQAVGKEVEHWSQVTWGNEGTPL